MDARVGEKLPEWVVDTVSAERMKTMALILSDPNPIHWNVEAVRRLGLGERPVNQGPTNAAYVVNMLTEWAGDPRRLRSLRVRFLGNVFADDRVVAGGEVTEVDDTGGETIDVWLDRDGGRVLSGTATVSREEVDEE